MVEIRCVGFRMEDRNELLNQLREALDDLGMKASAFVAYDDSYTSTLLDNKPFPYVVVSSDEDLQLQKVSAKLQIELGVLIKVEKCSALLPLRTDRWINRGR